MVFPFNTNMGNKCRILFSVPTAAAKKKEIIKLYESILTGSSKCHATGNEKDASGGWY